jgi:tRNA-dihydrouridine synthase A
MLSMSNSTHNLGRRGTTRPISVAPMMDRTDRHFRFFLRQCTKKTLLYTEMKTAAAIIHGDRKRLLGFSPEEHPTALQLGGSDPKALTEAAQIGEGLGFDEINLNVGCPSSRVKKGAFGACLMAKPKLVAQCVSAMRGATTVPITVKHRIGIDEIDTYQDMETFVRIVADSGCDRFSVHARKAWLQGLSPKENRTVPPLRYGEVHRLKDLEKVDAVMLGRVAYENPFLFAEMDRRYFGDKAPSPTRKSIVQAMLPYIEKWHGDGEPLHRITRHMLTLFVGQPGTKAWKQTLSSPHGDACPVEHVLRAYRAVEEVQATQALDALAAL